MESPESHSQLTELLYKSLGLITSILLGILGLVGRLMFEGKNLGKWQKAGIVLLSVFIGYQTSNLCDYMEWDNLRKILVPTTTMYGQHISAYITQNYSRILNGILDILFNRKGKK